MKAFLLGAAMLALVAPTAASARDASVAVRTGDLALDRPVDTQRLLRRLDKAALAVCGGSHVSVREQQRAVRATDCYAQAMDDALDAAGATAAVPQRARAAAR
jgi:UrcA family protein